jgi:hypothetical protein
MKEVNPLTLRILSERHVMILTMTVLIKVLTIGQLILYLLLASLALSRKEKLKKKEINLSYLMFFLIPQQFSMGMLQMNGIKNIYVLSHTT